MADGDHGVAGAGVDDEDVDDGTDTTTYRCHHTAAGEAEPGADAGEADGRKDIDSTDDNDSTPLLQMEVAEEEDGMKRMNGFGVPQVDAELTVAEAEVHDADDVSSHQYHRSQGWSA